MQATKQDKKNKNNKSNSKSFQKYQISLPSYLNNKLISSFQNTKMILNLESFQKKKGKSNNNKNRLFKQHMKT